MALRLNGGGDIYFKGEEGENMEYQENGCVGNSSESTLHDSTAENVLDILEENEILSNRDNSISEQDIRDILFEADYNTEDINSIVSTDAVARINESANSSMTDESDSDLGGKNALDLLKDIRIKNVNKIIIGTLNMNSIASK